METAYYSPRRTKQLQEVTMTSLPSINDLLLVANKDICLSRMMKWMPNDLARINGHVQRIGYECRQDAYIDGTKLNGLKYSTGCRCWTPPMELELDASRMLVYTDVKG
jgi:hypothetical protein